MSENRSSNSLADSWRSDAQKLAQRVAAAEIKIDEQHAEIERLTSECAEHIRKRGEAGERNIALTAERDRLRAALTMMYDKWENGDGCSDDTGVFLGNAFRLTEAEEDQVLALIPAQREPSNRNPAQPSIRREADETSEDPFCGDRPPYKD